MDGIREKEEEGKEDRPPSLGRLTPPIKIFSATAQVGPSDRRFDTSTCLPVHRA